MESLIVCVTGGIASGKTFVADYFHDHGAETIDADLIAREVVEVGRPGLKQIRRQFGDEVLNDDGTLNRPVLKQLVFNDSDLISALNHILHPLIGDEIKLRINDSKSKIIVLVIPLFKKAMIKMYAIDRVLLIDVDEKVQLSRVMKRDGVDFSLAQKIISSQSNRIEKIRLADDVIVNNDSFDLLKQRSACLYGFYQSMV